MASVPGEFDKNYGLDADAQAAIAALATGDGKKKPDETDDEREDREREEAEKKQAERDAAAVDEGVEAAADADIDDAEERARAMGWVPQAEFRGDPEKWRPAAEWLERGFANPYILKSLNDRLDATRKSQAAEIAKLKTSLDESTQVVRAINARFENADKAGYDRAVNEAKARQKEAVSEADTEKFDKASADLAALETRGPPKSLPAPTAPAGGDQKVVVEPEIATWADQNKWFATEPELADYAGVVDKQLQREYAAAGKTEASVGAGKHMDEIARRVKLRYADHDAFKNENPRRSARNSVAAPSGDRGTNGTGNGNGKPRKYQRLYENLPSDAKEACDKQIRVMGNGKDGKPYYSREKYCAVYDWPPEFY